MTQWLSEVVRDVRTVASRWPAWMREEKGREAMNEHTPTPWKWGKTNLLGPKPPDGVEFPIRDSDGYWLLEGIQGHVRARCVADGEFIVRACNSHAALVQGRWRKSKRERR